MQSNLNLDIYGEAPDKMTYTEQANKRSHCQRLTCFIRLADYLIVGTLHVLAVNSVQSLFNYYTEQLENTPTLAAIQEAPQTEEEKKAAEAAKKETTKKIAVKGVTGLVIIALI
jgi:dynein heavy chain